LSQAPPKTDQDEGHYLKAGSIEPEQENLPQDDPRPIRRASLIDQLEAERRKNEVSEKTWTGG